MLLDTQRHVPSNTFLVRIQVYSLLALLERRESGYTLLILPRQREENTGQKYSPVFSFNSQEKELTSKEREEMETYWMPIIKEDDKLRCQNVRLLSYNPSHKPPPPSPPQF